MANITVYDGAKVDARAVSSLLKSLNTGLQNSVNEKSTIVHLVVLREPQGPENPSENNNQVYTTAHSSPHIMPGEPQFHGDPALLDFQRARLQCLALWPTYRVVTPQPPRLHESDVRAFRTILQQRCVNGQQPDQLYFTASQNHPPLLELEHNEPMEIVTTFHLWLNGNMDETVTGFVLKWHFSAAKVWTACEEAFLDNPESEDSTERFFEAAFARLLDWVRPAPAGWPNQEIAATPRPLPRYQSMIENFYWDGKLRGCRDVELQSGQAFQVFSMTIDDGYGDLSGDS